MDFIVYDANDIKSGDTLAVQYVQSNDILDENFGEKDLQIKIRTPLAFLLKIYGAFTHALPRANKTNGSKELIFWHPPTQAYGTPPL